MLAAGHAAQHRPKEAIAAFTASLLAPAEVVMLPVPKASACDRMPPEEMGLLLSKALDICRLPSP